MCRWEWQRTFAMPEAKLRGPPPSFRKVHAVVRAYCETRSPDRTFCIGVYEDPPMLKCGIAGLSFAILMATPVFAQKNTSHAPAGTSTIGTTPAPINNAGAAAAASAAGAMSTNTPSNNVGLAPNGS